MTASPAVRSWPQRLRWAVRSAAATLVTAGFALGAAAVLSGALAGVAHPAGAPSAAAISHEMRAAYQVRPAAVRLPDARVASRPRLTDVSAVPEGVR